ncbi:MAG TPA: VCBS repeat-containing protein, partial [Polyangia bacterium]|nr:VCBS repeat-containing protein [Polyangia bacterium]
IGKPCTDPNECQGDTYCCTGACRKDGMAAGVCLPGNVPPGIACKGPATIGVFSPQIQCEWTDDTSSFVASSPVVADLPNDANSAEIVFISFGVGTADNGSTTGVVRIISGNDCRLLETITDPPVRANTTPALGDLDGDGVVEIVALLPDGKPVAFRWNGTRYVRWWAATTGPSALATQMWSGVSIHNLDEDNIAEVLVGTNSAGKIHTFNGATGQEIGMGVPTGTVFNGMIPIVGDLDGDKIPDLLTNWGETVFVTKWMGAAASWEPINFGRVDQQIAVVPATQFALADFGTVGATPEAFDRTKLDGIPEIVAVDGENGNLALLSRGGQTIMRIHLTKDAMSPALNEGGGPPVIGDFDNDGFPEIGVAGGSRFRVFDLQCTAAGGGCEAPFIRWSQPSQDASSRQTGASVFDFDGDGKSEVVYADECFLRIYAGLNGEVLYSTPRTSGTWYENPVVADVDRDDRAEIVINSAYHAPCPTNGTPGKPYVDPIHPGVRCLKADDCVLGTTCGNGFCRCAGDNQCDKGLSCQPALPGTAGTGNVCRSTHPNTDPKVTPVKGGIRVVNDRLDRWASSLPIWNQHAYSITNVKPNGQIPKMSEWMPNWKETKKGYNSFRQNAQGTANIEDLADVTGKLDIVRACRVKGQKVTLTGRVCNRGSRAVGSKLPATFYDKDNKILCVSYTADPVQSNNDCKAVSCVVDGDSVQGIVRMVVNDDGKGGRTTVECRSENNTDQIELKLSDCIVE